MLRIVLLAREESGPSDAAFDVASLPEMTLALLHSAWGEATSHAIGSRAGRRHPRLHWDTLIKTYGDEAILRKRIEEVKAWLPPSDIDDIVGLAERYLAGWRPDRFCWTP